MRSADDAAENGAPGAARLIAFSTLAVPVNAANVPLSVYLPAIYAQQYHLPLAVLGTIFLLERLWGAVADPLIGTLSDRTRSRFGRRKPWIAVGGLIFALAGVPLFFPPAAINPIALGLILFSFYLGWSMLQIPYLAWSGELSGDYHQRTRIVTYQTVLGAAALFLVLLLPTLIDRWRPGDAPLKLGAMGAFLVCSVLPGLILTLRACPEPPIPARPQTRTSLATSLRVIVGETLLLRVLGSDFAINLAQNIRAVLFVFFVSSVAGSPQLASGLFLLQFVFGIAAGPIWMRIGYRLGKHRAAIAGELVQVAINLGLLLIGPHRLPLLIALTVVQGLAQGSGNQMLRAIVADVADKHRLDTGVDRAALFFSLFSLTAKAAMAVAIGVTLPLVAWLGFSATGANTAHALWNLHLIFALGPALAHVAAAWLILGFPLDEHAHDEIPRALAAQAIEPVEAEVAITTAEI